MSIIGIFSCAYFLSIVFTITGNNYPAAAILIFTSVYLYYTIANDNKNSLNLKALWILGFGGGLGVSLLKLSHLSKDYLPMTWFCFYLAIVCFCLGYDIINRRKEESRRGFLVYAKPSNLSSAVPHENDDLLAGFIKKVIIVLLSLSVFAFLFELAFLKFIPLFSIGTPHAYSEFHIVGVHYITTLYVIVPTIAVIYFIRFNRRDYVFYAGLIIPFILGLLLVSRSQIMMSAVFAFFAYVLMKRRINTNLVIAGSVVLVISYVILTVARSHSIEYLKGIFEMKVDLPIFISQPYTYIANNYENFNLLVGTTDYHRSLGLKMLYPVFTLSFAKFKWPWLVYLYNVVNKPELTTVTIIYDAYFDFGFLGVAGFTFVLGMISAKLNDLFIRKKSLFIVLIYAQYAFYMFFSFFTTWFTIPQTWVYMILSVLIYYLYMRKEDEIGETYRVTKNEYDFRQRKVPKTKKGGIIDALLTALKIKKKKDGFVGFDKLPGADKKRN